tara:strand:+ start:222 stop:437 length:216 start_codon:yes stop_codon:yes gene_type:complete
MIKDLNIRDAVWLALVIFGAGASYMMLSSRLEAVESKTKTLESIAIVEIPEIKERLVRLETKLDILLENQK